MFRLSWLKLCGLSAFALVVVASLMLPEQVERLRTGHWFAEHFVGYFVASAVICLAWRRPFVVAGVLTFAAFILEGLQAWTPNHSPNLLSVVAGASGVWLAALFVWAVGVASSRRKAAG
jgi:VanZ family protein